MALIKKDIDVTPVTATVEASAQTVYTAPAGATAFGEVVLVATNVSGAAVTLTVEKIQSGGTPAQGERVVNAMSLPASGEPVTLFDGDLTLFNGATLRAFASVASAVNLSGWVNEGP